MTEIIRLSQKAKDQLVWLKRQTGIKHWNVLCRWAFCVSLSDNGSVAEADSGTDSNVEMNWKTFSGHYGEIYRKLLEAWARKHGFIEYDFAELARKHIHRGIQRLVLEKNTSLKTVLKLVS